MKIIVRESDGRILGTIAEADDVPVTTIVGLSGEQQTQIRAFMSEPNVGLVYSEGEVTALPLPLPEVASAGDFIKALIELDWFDAVEAAVAAVPGNDGKLARALWSRAAVFEKQNAIVQAVAGAIGKTSADLDELFVLANSYS